MSTGGGGPPWVSDFGALVRPLLICPFPLLLGVTGLPLGSFFSLDVPLPYINCTVDPYDCPPGPYLQGLGGCDTSRGPTACGFGVQGWPQHWVYYRSDGTAWFGHLCLFDKTS